MIELFGRLSESLGLPINASSHGLMVDQMNGWVHWLMIILFVGWGIFFILTLYKFGFKKQDKVDPEGVKSHVSTYTEYAIILVEAFLLIGFAIPLWSMVRTDVPEVTHDTVEVRVIAQQFAWNIHYPGADGIFGPTSPYRVDEEINPIGLDRSSEHGADDIVTLNQMHLPVYKQALIYLSTKDVIHSFSLPEMRVKQDAIPGMSIPVFFTPTMTSEEFLEAIKNTERYNPEYSFYGLDKEMWDNLDASQKNPYRGFQIACAQLCGNSHFKMRGFLTVESDDEFDAWLEEEAEYLGGDDDDDW